MSNNDEDQSTARQWQEMREEKTKDELDPSLQSPQDANTQKHINFLETEETETSGSQSEDEQSPTQQQWKEMREERMNENQDSALQSPQDANTQKHINFLESDETETNR